MYLKRDFQVQQNTSVGMYSCRSSSQSKGLDLLFYIIADFFYLY